MSNYSEILRFLETPTKTLHKSKEEMKVNVKLCRLAFKAFQMLYGDCVRKLNVFFAFDSPPNVETRFYEKGTSEFIRNFIDLENHGLMNFIFQKDYNLPKEKLDFLVYMTFQSTISNKEWYTKLKDVSDRTILCIVMLEDPEFKNLYSDEKLKYGLGEDDLGGEN